MLLIECPFCGPRDQTEYSYGGDATVVRPTDPAMLDDQAWSDYLNLRANPAGEHDELWQHSQGCRRWIGVRRNTLTHEILATWPPASSKTA